MSSFSPGGKKLCVTPKPRQQNRIILTPHEQPKYLSPDQENFIMASQLLSPQAKGRNAQLRTSKSIKPSESLALHLENYMNRKKIQYKKIFSQDRYRDQGIGVMKYSIQIPRFRLK